MGKTSTILGAFLLALFLITSCGNPVENDAKKLAELTCEATQLAKKATKAALSGDNSLLEESKEVSSKLKTLSEELKSKYTSDSDKKKLQEVFRREFANCSKNQ